MSDVETQIVRVVGGLRDGETVEALKAHVVLGDEFWIGGELYTFVQSGQDTILRPIDDVLEEEQK